MFEKASPFVKNAFSKVITNNESILNKTAKIVDDTFMPISLVQTANKKYNGKNPKEKAADNGFEINETENGGADFSNTEYVYKTASGQEATAKIEMSGKRSQDTKALFDNLGISKEEQKELLKDNKVFYLDDFDPDTGQCTIQLVDQEAYDIVKRYAGAQAQYNANTGVKYR